MYTPIRLNKANAYCYLLQISLCGRFKVHFVLFSCTPLILSLGWIFINFFCHFIYFLIEGELQNFCCSVKHQQESAIGTPMSPPSWTSLPSPSPSHPSRLIYLQGSNGETDIENRLMDTGKGEERVRCMERVPWKLTLPYVKQIANGNLLCVSGNSNRGSTGRFFILLFHPHQEAL